MFEGLRFQHWQPSRADDGVVVLTLDRAGSSVNALSRAVLDELSEIIERLSFEPPKGIVIRSGKAAGFIVGADIKEFESFERNGTVQDALENGQRIFQKLARLPCPTVAAIHGVCMGGGTELALACRYRVASRAPSTRIALPEVKLGIFPGWGGSARLPRLIGAPAALELMLTGRAASAENAKAIGLVDRLTSPELLLDAAREMIRHPRPRAFTQRATAWATNTWPARQVLAPILVKQTAAKVRKDQYPAPFALIETWRRGGSSISQRLKLEARAVAKLAQTLDRTQPDPRVLPAGTPESARQRRRARDQTRARGRRRRDGRRHRRLVRLARLRRDLAGPRDEVRAAGARSRPRTVREKAQDRRPHRSGARAPAWRMSKALASPVQIC